ncbi:hypothetical protein HEP73_02128 [Xanthomonas sp. GW]|uniref:hypothetical protein n=1 Tax=Xanthomonas sp. GW TaxID=2724121 RepID=UPI00163A880D|nr:hypothetical protein [Xanthomonas sp. GW]QNH21216.1 hypothetical protein HEP73_02128 [Xanthomonas sp. GW]
MTAQTKGVDVQWPVRVHPVGHGQWGFVAGPRSGTGFASKKEAEQAGNAARSKALARIGAPVDPIAVLDSQIAELRASGDTGNVENLLEAREAFAEAIKAHRYIAKTWPDSAPAKTSRAALARCGATP